MFDTIGYNFEPSEMGAAYGLVQLDKLDGFNQQRRDNWQRLDDFMATRTGVTAARTTDDTDTTWQTTPVPGWDGDLASYLSALLDRYATAPGNDWADHDLEFWADLLE